VVLPYKLNYFIGFDMMLRLSVIVYVKNPNFRCKEGAI